jgi:hypothetical protein
LPPRNTTSCKCAQASTHLPRQHDQHIVGSMVLVMERPAAAAARPGQCNVQLAETGQYMKLHWLQAPHMQG